MKTSNPIVRTILTEENAPINEESEVTRSVAEYFKDVYAIPSEERVAEYLDQLMEEVKQDLDGERSTTLFTPEDIEEAIRDCNFKKELGPDGFDGNLLTKIKVKGAEEDNLIAESLRHQVLLMLNKS